MSIKQKIAESVVALPRPAKRIIAIFCDLSLCIICVVVAFYLRLEQLVYLRGPVFTAAWISLVLALPIFWLSGLYRTIFRYSGVSIIFSVALAVTIYGLLYFCIIGLYQVTGIPRSIGIIQPMLLFLAIVFSRLPLKFIFSLSYEKNNFMTY